MRSFVAASRHRILVSGTAPVADALLAGLRKAGRPAERLEGQRRKASALRGARALVLACSGSDRIPGLGELAEACSSRSRRMPPLRVILVFPGDPPPGFQETPEYPGMVVETLNLETGFARGLLARRPLHVGMDPLFGQTPHLLFAGDASPSTALAVQSMRLAHYGEYQAVVTLACDDPQAWRRSLLADYPEAGRICRLRFTGLERPDLPGEPPVTGVFVCQDEPERGLDTARRLALWIERCQGVSPEIHLEVGGEEPAADACDWDGQIFPFSWLREACRPEVWFDGRGDELARVVHDHYRDSIASQGREPDAELAGRAWEDLATSYRDANRFQADHLWAKLAVTDCRAVPEEQVESFSFAPLEVERLAIIEHARWAADRHLGGWTYAPKRDNARKHHPQLVPYDDLSEPMKDLDRFAVRLVPVLLARSGRGVVRMLIVGLPDAAPDLDAGRALSRLSGLALERLTRRYPDRSLILASTLRDEASRVVARQALECFSAGLFFLSPWPVRETIEAQPDGEARRDLLDLVARAERRICLNGEDRLEDWFAGRAEILMLLGGDRALDAPVKHIVLNPGAADPQWNFEY